VRVTFLLGPAGSGKTRRCLQEIRDELLASAEGPPLLMLAPRQATFQLERQLLADERLAGYTRLQIIGFQRLAELIVDAAGTPARLLDEEGRVMVLRALIGRLERQGALGLFGASASLPGFAREVSATLRELQRHGIGVGRLRQLAARQDLPRVLADKLADLARLLEAYEAWLAEHGLEDADRLPSRAVECLRRLRNEGVYRIAGLWLDGFAELTPQELELLAALAPLCEKGTVAFCLDGEPAEDPLWVSTWAVVARTYRRCRAALESVDGCEIRVEPLKREKSCSRFTRAPALAHLEARWAGSTRPLSAPDPGNAVALRDCANPEAEAVEAARQILQHVRDGHGRYRECAVLVRSLEGYADVLRRVFTRYQIPHFVDQREPVSHHPLAELTRHTLRLVAGGWRLEDWLGILKTGLAPATDEEVDELENEALKRGWTGSVWREPFVTSGERGCSMALERLRERLTRPFLKFETALAALPQPPTGPGLAGALRALWEDLDVAGSLTQWIQSSVDDVGERQGDDGIGSGPLDGLNRAARAQVHRAVWEEMQGWLDNLAVAFSEASLGLREWLAVVEAGLSGLTVGVIPPALDQVLVGAVDRSRNPDLRLVVACGWNEGRFPAAPPVGGLLNEVDREELERQQVCLAAGSLLRLGHERYLAYIACTRAQERLVVTWSQADAEGNELKPSLFVEHLRGLFPGRNGTTLVTSPGGRERPWFEAENTMELAPFVLRWRSEGGGEPPAPWSDLEQLPSLAPVLARWDSVQGAIANNERVSRPEVIYGEELRLSVSALEMFAACPFKFFVGRGLGAQERELFEIDDRKCGQFQHQAMQVFHERIGQSGRRWRDLEPDKARELMRDVASQLLEAYGTGLFTSTASARFEGEGLIQELTELAEVLTAWARHYGFDPAAAEVGFGLEDASLPGWEVQVGEGKKLILRGVIDRVDLAPNRGDGSVLAVVQDYKSRVRPLHPRKLAGGLQLQLLSYLGALREIPEASALFGARRIIPAGVFYIPLRATAMSATTRAEGLSEGARERRNSLVHQGRFDIQWKELFDTRPQVRQGEQFRFRLTTEGKLIRRGSDGLPTEEFERLLAANEEHLRRIGRSIFAGEASAAPYRLGEECACDRCDYRPICRFDSWVQPCRKLPALPESREPAKAQRPAKRPPRKTSRA